MYSVIFSSNPTCLFSNPLTNSDKTPHSRGVKVSYRVAKNQAARIGGTRSFEKLVAGCKGLGTKANRLDEILNRLAHSPVVIDDVHRRNTCGLHERASAPLGRVKLKAVPAPRLATAHTRPPYASPIEWVIVNPIAVPCGFVV